MPEQDGEPPHDREAEPHAARPGPAGASGHLGRTRRRRARDARARCRRRCRRSRSQRRRSAGARRRRRRRSSCSAARSTRGCGASGSSSTGSESTDRRVRTKNESERSRERASTANSCASRSNSGESGTRSRLGSSAPASSREVDQLRELGFERDERATRAGDQRRQLAVARAPGQRRDEQPERVERLAQVVTRRGEELALAPIGVLGRRTGVQCGARARLELADQVGVAVARRQRIGEHVVQPYRKRARTPAPRPSPARCTGAPVRPRNPRAGSAAPARAARSRRTTACTRRSG